MPAFLSNPYVVAAIVTIAILIVVYSLVALGNAYERRLLRKRAELKALEQEKHSTYGGAGGRKRRSY